MLMFAAKFRIHHYAGFRIYLCCQLGGYPYVGDLISFFDSANSRRYLGFALTDGGTGLLFWGFIVCACGQSLVYASIAEMASM